MELIQRFEYLKPLIQVILMTLPLFTLDIKLHQF